MATEKEGIEERLAALEREFIEREKELNCIYGISALVDQPGITLEEIIQGIVDLMPAAWQYPEIACARAILEEQEFKTENFRETPWKQTSDIMLHGERNGYLELYYLEEKPENDEGPFLKEERNLINNIAERLGKITERVQVVEALHIERDNLKNIFEAIEDGIYIVNQQYDIQYVNPMLIKDFGIYEGRKCYEYFHNRTEVCPWCMYPDVLAGKTVNSEWYSFKNQKTYDMIDTPLINADGSISKLKVFRDITERNRTKRELEERKQYLEALVESVPDAIVTLDTRNRIVEWNSAAEKMFKYTQKEAIGQDIDGLVTVPSIHEEASRLTQTAISEEGLPHTEGIRYRKDGSPVDVLIAGSNVMVEGELHGAVGIYTDTTELKRAQAALRKLAIRDPLVGCFNRRHFFSLAEKELARAARYKRQFSVIMLDIDHFKRVNDNYGHSVGDQFLVAIAGRIEGLLRSTDIFARYGGEEFVILLPEANASQARQAAEMIRENTAEPIRINELEIPSSISFGVSCRNIEDDITMDALLDRADQALYAAKRGGRNRVMVWPISENQ